MRRKIKRLVPYVGAAILLAAIIAVFFIAKNDNKLVTSKPEPATKQTSASNFKSAEACDVVTQSDADALLGAGAKLGDNSIGDTSSEDIAVSTCTYSQAGSFKSLTLLARSAKTRDGTDSNKDQFTTRLPNDAKHVNGFGDDAYWDPTYGQLNILAHDNWYILSIGGLRPSEKTLDEAKSFAARVISRL